MGLTRPFRKELRAHSSVPRRRTLAPGCGSAAGKAVLVALSRCYAPGDHRLRRALAHRRRGEHVGRGCESRLLGRRGTADFSSYLRRTGSRGRVAEVAVFVRLFSMFVRRCKVLQMGYAFSACPGNAPRARILV